MSNIIQNGASTTVNLQTGEKLAVSAIDGTFSAVIRAGVGVGTALATNSLGGEYGPYVSPVVIQISSSADGLVDFEVGTVPTLDYREAVTAVTNPLTGGISLQAGADFVTPMALRAEGSFSTKRCPYLKTSTATNDPSGYTYQTILAAESPFNSFRIGFLNGESGTVTISKVIAGVAPIVGTGASSFYNVLFGGASSVDLPAKLGINRPSITWSDWLLVGSVARTDGLGTLPLAVVRTLISPGQAAFSQTFSGDSLSWLNDQAAGGANLGRVWKTQRKNVDAVNTTANWTSPTDVTHSLPMVIEFAHTKLGVTVLNVGDSIRVGSPSDSSFITNGDAFKAVLSLSSIAKPVSLINAAWGGDNSTNYTARAVDLIASTRPDVVLFDPFTVNDGTPADFRIAWQLGQFVQVLQAAKAVNAKVIAVNGMCNTTSAWTLAQDAQRLALNATLLTMGIPVVDQDSIATDGATPARFASGASTDGIHPNAAIYTAIAPLTASAIESVIF